MVERGLSRRSKIAISLGMLAALSFLLLAFFIFLRDGDWPAKYISIGISLFAVIVVALRRRARRLN